MNRSILAVMLVLTALGAFAEGFTGTVTGIVDGDTFTMKTADGTEYTVHVRCVDSPEPAQAFGPEAKQFAEKLLSGKTVGVEPADAESTPMPAIVTLPDGADVGEALLSAGMGWYTDADGTDGFLCKAAAAALTGKKGLWANPAPLAPWDFRGDARRPKVEPAADASAKDETAAVSVKEVVWVTKDGQEYHKGDCNRLDKTRKPLALDKAKSLKYTKCSACFREKPKEDAPVVAKKGDYENVPRVFFPQFKDDPIYKQLQPSWHLDASGNIAGITAGNLSNFPIAAVLGFQDGDVIQSVNGDRIDSPEKVMALIEKNKGAKSVSVGIVRNGVPTTIEVPIPNLGF